MITIPTDLEFTTFNPRDPADLGILEIATYRGLEFIRRNGSDVVYVSNAKNNVVQCCNCGLPSEYVPVKIISMRNLQDVQKEISYVPYCAQCDVPPPKLIAIQKTRISTCTGHTNDLLQ